MSKLLDQVRDVLRLKHYSYRTEQAYLDWIKRFIIFHGKRHPLEMGVPEVSQFLTHLAVERCVAASTQNQALAALLFLYRDVLKQPLARINDVERAKRPEKLPVVLSRDDQASNAGITCRKALYKRPSKLLSNAPVSLNPQAAIRCAIASLRICSKRDMIFAPFKNCWVTKMSARP